MANFVCKWSLSEYFMIPQQSLFLNAWLCQLHANLFKTHLRIWNLFHLNAYCLALWRLWLSNKLCMINFSRISLFPYCIIKLSIQMHHHNEISFEMIIFRSIKTIQTQILCSYYFKAFQHVIKIVKAFNFLILLYLICYCNYEKN